MAVRFRLPVEALLDTDVLALAGGSISFCLTKTTDLQAVYTDDDLTIPALNPYTLDSVGQHGDIFLGAFDYRVIVKNAAGSIVPYGDMDPIHGDDPSATAADLTYTAPGGGAVERPVDEKLAEAVSVGDYGAVGDGAANDTTPVINAAAVLQAAGGGTLLFPPGIYAVASPVGGTLVTFTSLNGITIECMDGARIVDTTSYTGVQLSNLFKFVACNNIDLKLRVVSQVDVTTGTTNSRGVCVAQCEQGCKGVKVDLDLTGCQAGLVLTKASGDPASYISKHVSGKIRATGCYSPYKSQYGCDDATLQIYADTCGRNFYIYGSRAQRLTVLSKNQQVTSVIAAFNGYGCEDVDASITDLESDDCNGAAPVLALHWGDSTAATHRNIRLRMNTKIPAGSPWGNTIEFNKFSDGAMAADSTGRGHILDGFSLSGFMSRAGVPGAHMTLGLGAFASTDAFRNIRIHDLTLVSNSSFDIPLNVLANVAVFDNVRTEHNIYTSNTTNSIIRFVGCVAANFTAATSNTDTHEYHSCWISAGDVQNYSSNKRFFNTLLPNISRKTGVNVLRAEKAITGNLTGTNNIFKVSVGDGLRFRVKYFLCADRTDTASATRDETAGIKSFSAYINSSGTWTIQLAVADEVTERIQGTASVLTLSLVTGDANGAYVAAACTNYSGANARAVFEAEALCIAADATLQAVV